MFTSAFTEVVMKPTPEASSIAYSKAQKTIQFKIQVPRIGDNHRICVLGNSAKLGNWDITKPFSFGIWREVSSMDRKCEHGRNEIAHTV
jgi:hypothetical protein